MLPQTLRQNQTQAQSQNCSCPVEARGLSVTNNYFQSWPTGGEGCQGGAECRYWHALSVALNFHHQEAGVEISSAFST